MAGITQYYKSRVLYENTNGSDGNPLPILPNGASLNWGANRVVPFIAGNYWQANHIVGAQTPMIDLSVSNLDGVANRCPLSEAFLNTYFMDRSDDYAHDTAPMNNFTFFDGWSGFRFKRVKWNSFTISGSKGDDVSFRGNLMVFSPGVGANYGDDIEQVTAMSNSTGFTGNPIRFQSLSFFSGGVCLDGVVSFSMSYSNNITADQSMVCGDALDSYPGEADQWYQSPLPVDCNAGQMQCSLQMVFQAHNEDAIDTGAPLEIYIRQGAISTLLRFKKLLNDTKNNRNVGFGRQMRSYNFIVVGAEDTTTPPLLVEAA